MVAGFFSKEGGKSISRPDGKVHSCISCGLYQYVLSLRMGPSGRFKKKVLNIGEAPGETEDRKGKQWQGKVGTFLKATYRKYDIDLFEDCLNINAINCRPTSSTGSNRSPQNEEVLACRPRVLKVIEDYKPRIIVVLGNHAVSCILGHRWKDELGGIGKWRGWQIPDRDFKAVICPIYHPSYVERTRKDRPEIRTVWEQDIANISKLVNGSSKITFGDMEEDIKKIEIVTEPEALLKKPLKLIAFDYETTGLKPNARGHKIVCVSIATNINHVYVFLLPPVGEKRKAFKKVLKQIFQDEKIAKIGHNIKFEENWTRTKLGVGIKNWAWDSMLAAHLLDNRRGVSGLKFQTYVNFGVVDYSSEVNPYLDVSNSRKSKTGTNTKNKVEKLLRSKVQAKKLMRYCALDSLYTYRLALKQMRQLGMKKQDMLSWMRK